MRETFDLTDEGDIEEFLGIKITKNTNKSIITSQPGLIDQLIKTVGIYHDYKIHFIPVTNTPLGLHDDRSPRITYWNYRSSIGQLDYISKNTRPDIELAVHQCSKYQINPKNSHEQAVKRISRYLLDTKDKGIIIQPTKYINNMEFWVYSDFAGE